MNHIKINSSQLLFLNKFNLKTDITNILIKQLNKYKGITFDVYKYNLEDIQIKFDNSI